MFGIYGTHALRLADRHGVFTHLSRHGPATASAIAADLGLDAETLERLMLLLKVLGLLEEAGGGRYGLPAAVTAFLVPDADRYLGGFVDHLVTDASRQLELLDEYLRRGKEVVDAGMPDAFTRIYRDGPSTERFMAAMWQLSHHASGRLADLADLGSVTRLIDVGGACGPFAIAALRRNPTLRATVFDLPEVEPFLKARRREYGLEGRLAFRAGDFFRDPLPQGDCVAFGYILSDWTDAACRELVRSAFEACVPGGRILVMERLFADDRSGPIGAAVMNLSMHVETQGRHRSAREYIELLESAGFAECEVRRTDGDKHLVMARRPA
ncbi:methyltransferase [Actinomadura graeca]|uniref:methyltransferase n=1 Tax=Actinomadura graeca TaxID=2750812 RepID=UPI001E639317|nr:methyltransferase [Actinomadura graeca]